MQNAVWAILYHSVMQSSPKKHHKYSPKRDTSWCKWQKDQALNPKQKTYSDAKCLPEIFLEARTPLFTKLSNPKLLERCLEGFTKNANESVNSVVWTRAPKHKYQGMGGVRTAAAAAICSVNDGAVSEVNRPRQMNLTEEEHTISALKKRNHLRLYHAAKKETDEATIRRAKGRRMRKATEEKRNEGNPTYLARGFGWVTDDQQTDQHVVVQHSRPQKPRK